jgi:dTDP-4-amino-4,6-dideoxygalactose transaminase
VNTICTQQHKGKIYHNNPETSYFFFTIQLESNKNIQNQMQQRNLQHEGMHHNNSTTPQMSHDYFDTRLGLHQELSRHYQLGL